MSDKQERIARALERIADALERYNRAALYEDPARNGSLRTTDGVIRECVMVEIANCVSVAADVTVEK